MKESTKSQGDKRNTKKNVLFHIIAIVALFVVSTIYFLPVMSGDVVMQGDVQKAEAMAHQQRTYADSTGTIPNWNPSMFSGMPGYQTEVEAQKSIFTPLKRMLTLRPMGLERNIGMMWLYLLGFYVALIAFGCNIWLALLGAVAFGLGSYNIIIIEAGHITKGWAMSMIAPILAGMVLCLRSVDKNDESQWKIKWRQMVWGAILFTLALGLQITFNHIQITFYTMIGGIAIGITYLVYAIKDKWFKQFLATVGILLVGCVFAAGGNYRHLTINQEYQKVTMRGGSEITVKPHDIGAEDIQQEQVSQSGGLDINYAFSWSYGVGETYTIMVPGAMGGGSGEKVSDDSEFAKRYGQTRAPLYWGDQPFTSGPVYFGAIIIFLFILGCFIVKGPERWWIIAATIIAILLSWGRHFLPLNGFLFDHLPLYNKFRTPSMALVLANVCMVIMAVLAIKAFVSQPKEKKPLYWAAGIAGGVLVIGMIVGSSTLTYNGPDNDANLKQEILNAYIRSGLNHNDANQMAQFDQQLWPEYHNTVVAERKSLFMRDSFRSIVFVFLAFGLLWLYSNDKIKKSNLVAILLTLLTLIDLWGIDRRYLNKDNFTDPDRVALKKNATEHQLDMIAAANADKDYRVYDLSVNTFNDSRPSAFHNEIGGYSAAKLRRYQDLIDFYLGSNKVYDYVNKCQIGIQGETGGTPLLAVQESYPVLDMLNARYMMLNLQRGQGPTPVRRNSALGNCWLVEEVKMVDDANAEILALNDFDPYKTAIIDKSKWGDKVDAKQSPRDSSETIMLVHTYPQTPDHLTYKSHTNGERIAVFSEIYYEPDWRVYIDGKAAEYFRADYVLRAMKIPAGDHTIEFVNEAPTLHRLDSLTLIISIIMVVAFGGALYLVYRKRGFKVEDTNN